MVMLGRGKNTTNDYKKGRGKTTLESSYFKNVQLILTQKIL